MTHRLLYALYPSVLIVMGAATFIESTQGTAFVHQYIYGSWWFAALWAALAIVGAIHILIYIIKSGKKRKAVIALHLSFIVILIGALLTHLFGENGMVHLRSGEQQDIALIMSNGTTRPQQLPFALALDTFQVAVNDLGGATDFSTTFRIIPKSSTQSVDTAYVSMNNIYTYHHYRFYQSFYDFDLCGSILTINHDPYGIPTTYCGYALLFLSFIALCIRRNASLMAWIGSALLTALWCVHYFVLDGSWQQVPVLRHPLLFIHVVIIILAYALLLIQALKSAYSLVRPRHAVSTDPTLVLLALCLLSIGIFLGAIWANISWGNYWSWDSKEVWALITLMVYAIPVHRHSLPAFTRPRVWHTYILIAFLAVLMTYFGVNHLLIGLHSYN